MDREDQQKSEMSTCWDRPSINDENNNFQDFSCSASTDQIRVNEQSNEQVMIGSDAASDDDYWCSSCSSSFNDAEIVSIDTQRLWNDVSQWIKNVYRESHEQFNVNHSSDEILRVKEYVQILTQLNGESLFLKIESIVIDNVEQIRHQVLKRFQTSSKTSHDIQTFFSLQLDEYYSFVQSAQNVSTVVSHLEENFLKSLNLTWLLYNKHLYEKFVYMDKKVQHSMSIMIDLFQPSTIDSDDYSPAECAQLLNRFLAFDEDMSEIACLYDVCQQRINRLTNHRPARAIFIPSKTNKNSPKNLTSSSQPENQTNSISTAVNIPSSELQPDSNGSSIESGIDGKDFSSIESADENEEKKEISTPIVSNETTTKSNGNDLFVETKKSKTRRKETTKAIAADPLPIPKPVLAPTLILPPKPPPSTISKFQADLRPLTIPLRSNNEASSCSSFLQSKFQTVSFTAGTFGSITPNNSTSSTTSSRLNVNLRPKSSSFSSTNFDQLFRQAQTTKEFSSLLSSLDTSEFPSEKPNDNEFCSRCHSLLVDEISSSNDLSLGCPNCLSIPHPTTTTTTMTHLPSQRKERLQIKISKRTSQTTVEPTINGNKTRLKPADNNIDDLVRFIDGDQTNSDSHSTATIKTNKESTSKKNKKKKGKQSNEKIVEPEKVPEETNLSKDVKNSSVLDSKQKRKGKSKRGKSPEKGPETLSSTATTTRSSTPSGPSEKANSIPSNFDSQAESFSQSEEEVNWTTVSRKQTKQKTTTTSTVSSTLVAPSSNQNKQKNQPTKSTKKSGHQHSATSAQSNVMNKPTDKSDNKTNSNKTPTVPLVSSRPQTQVKTPLSQPAQKLPPPSFWTNTTPTPEPIPVKPSSTLLATAPVFVPSTTGSSLTVGNKTNSVPPAVPYKDSSSSIYWNPNTYIQPLINAPTTTPGPVQRPISASSTDSSTFRCIQRPSSEPRASPLPSHSPPADVTDHSTSIWNSTTPMNNPNESLWSYPRDTSLSTVNTFEDFPLYDPFKSGAGLTIPTSTLLTTDYKDERFAHPQLTLDNPLNDFDREIDDFQKLSFTTDMLDIWSNGPSSTDPSFPRHS